MLRPKLSDLQALTSGNANCKCTRTCDLIIYWLVYTRPNGIRFTAAAGTTEFAKRWNPQPGDIVSFKHHGYLIASKKPKLATIYRMRQDLTWEDVVNNWKEQKSTPNGNMCSSLLLSFPFLFLSIKYLTALPLSFADQTAFCRINLCAKGTLAR